MSAFRSVWRRSPLYIVAAAAVCVVTLATRLPAPWRCDATIDEMKHLASWRNRHGDKDPLPVFRVRLAQERRLPECVKQALLDLYAHSSAFRFALFVQSDPPSAAFGLLAESIRVGSGSSLTALRVPSLLASLVTVWLAYLLGCELAGRVTGLCTAALFAISPYLQVYAGIGRPHPLSQLTLLLLLYVAVLARKGRGGSAWVLLAALIAQVAHWGDWAVVGPVVALEFVLLWRQERSLMQVLRKTWWYVLSSMLLLVICHLQAFGVVTFGNHLATPGAAILWRFWCAVSPLAYAACMGQAGSTVAGVAFALLALAGGVLLTLGTSARCGGPLLAAALGALVAMFGMCPGSRHMMLYATPLLVLAGIALGMLCEWKWVPRLLLTGTLLVLAMLELAAPLDPYRDVLDADHRYTQIAPVLEAEMRPGDQWIAFPYFLAEPLYRYVSLPAPLATHEGEKAFQAVLSAPRGGRGLVILTTREVQAREPSLAPLQNLIAQISSQCVLLRFPASHSP